MKKCCIHGCNLCKTDVIKNGEVKKALNSLYGKFGNPLGKFRKGVGMPVGMFMEEVEQTLTGTYVKTFVSQEEYDRVVNKFNACHENNVELTKITHELEKENENLKQRIMEIERNHGQIYNEKEKYKKHSMNYDNVVKMAHELEAKYINQLEINESLKDSCEEREMYKDQRNKAIDLKNKYYGEMKTWETAHKLLTQTNKELEAMSHEMGDRLKEKTEHFDIIKKYCNELVISLMKIKEVNEEKFYYADDYCDGMTETINKELVKLSMSKKICLECQREYREEIENKKSKGVFLFTDNSVKEDCEWCKGEKKVEDLQPDINAETVKVKEVDKRGKLCLKHFQWTIDGFGLEFAIDNYIHDDMQCEQCEVEKEKFVDSWMVEYRTKDMKFATQQENLTQEECHIIYGNLSDVVYWKMQVMR